jgi:hypothetical protein
VLQVENWVSSRGVFVISGRSVDKAAARGVCALGEIEDLSELAVRDILDGIDVLILGWDFDSATPAASTIKGLATGVGNLGAIDVDPIVMEPLI